MITIEQFFETKLRVATVVAAEAIPKSNKLLKLEVDLGDERRTLVAGIDPARSRGIADGAVLQVLLLSLVPVGLLLLLARGVVHRTVAPLRGLTRVADAIAHYADFYELRNVLLLGRVTSGEGGSIIVDHARRVLDDVFPERAGDIRIHTPDEKDKRHGQAVAAASLPRRAT